MVPSLAVSAHRNARRKRPKGVKSKYCPASRVSGPPPPRQAAGDPSAVFWKNFLPPTKIFFTHGLISRRHLRPFWEKDFSSELPPTFLDFHFQFRCGRLKSSPTPVLTCEKVSPPTRTRLTQAGPNASKTVFYHPHRQSVPRATHPLGLLNINLIRKPTDGVIRH